MIAINDISIVCQGAITPKHTEKCLHSLRSVFPGAELVLSTWEGSDTSGLDADIIVFSSDPGAFIADEVAKVLNNVNRQLVSTCAGVSAATRTFILKTRTDILFEDTKFIEYFGIYDNIPSPYFQNRLLICDYYTRNPRIKALCFHPSDWLVFGRKEDMYKYYMNSPLLTEEEGTWFRNRKKASTFFTNYICRFTPEQQIFLGFFRQQEKVDCDCYYARSKRNIEQTERAFAECFVVLDYGKQLRIKFIKYNPNRYLEKNSLITHWQWKALYKHYCERNNGIWWGMYLVRSMALYSSAKARVFCIRLLSALGIKEQVKAFLSKR